MKKSIRLTSAALALTLAISAAALPAAAANEAATKDESVYVTLAPDGSVQQQTVSVWLHRDGGLDGFADLSTLADVHDLKGTATPTQNGEELRWDTTASDLYYQGTTGRQLPVTAAITYTLDGQELTAGQLIGRSGHLKVTIALTNHERHTVTIDGSPRTVCTPFAAAVGTTLDADRFANVVAGHGTVQTDSAHAVAAWVCLPGMAETFDGLLTGSLREVQDKFVDTVTLEADVTDCPALSFMIASATDPSALSELDELDELDGVSEDLDKLRDATDQLLTGAADLLDGVLQLHDAVTGELADGVIKLDDSVNGQLATGAAQLRDGLAALNSNSAALNDGAAQLTDGIFQTATLMLQSATGDTSIQLTPDNYTSVINGILGIPEQTQNEAVSAVQSAVAQKAEAMTAALLTQLGPAGAALGISADQLGQLLTGALILQFEPTTGSVTPSGDLDADITAAAAAVQNQLNAVMANAASDPTALTSFVQNAASVSQEALTAAMTREVTAVIRYKYPDLDATLAQLGQVGQLKQLLDGAVALRGGISSYTAGVASAAEGGQQLYSGITGDLASGTRSLRAAVTGELTEGVDALLDGAHQLADGITEYDAEGIQQLTGREELNQLQALADTANALRAASESYTSYTGTPENTACTVKFIMKTQTPEPEPDEAAAGTADSADPAQPAAEPEHLSFWQRLVALFTGKK